MRFRGVAWLVWAVGCRFNFDVPRDDGNINANVDALPVCGSTGVDWAAWPIANTPGAGLPHPAAHTDSATTIHDDVTGLVWQRDPAAASMTWDQAKAYCAGLTLDGACWRLPQRVELISAIEYSRTAPASTFPGATNERYWSATPGPTGRGWTMDFNGGYPETRLVDEVNRVRCVQVSVDPPPNRYAISTDTILDQVTGLTWERLVDAGSYNFNDAQLYCSAKGVPWRSPSIQELQSIVDTSQTTVLVDPAAFPSTPPQLFWSGTTLATDIGSGWSLDFSQGIAFRNMGTTLRVRCVYD